MKDIFEKWAQWYNCWQNRQNPIPWDQGSALTHAQKRALGPSIAEFQLGEGSDGKNFYAAAKRYGEEIGSTAYPEAILEFIREENRHSAMLGKFMDQSGIPRRKHSMADAAFRWMRHMVPLVWSQRILVTAELLAVPYYRALFNATESAVLKAICTQILADEDNHIAFQAECIRHQMERKRISRFGYKWMSRILLELAADVIWFNHSEALRLGGYDFPKFRAEALEQLEWHMDMVMEKVENPGPQISHHLSRFMKIRSTLHI